MTADFSVLSINVSERTGEQKKPVAYALLRERGIDLAALPVGARLSIGEALLEITQIGKVCHTGCAISRTTGDCVMPRKGVFARVITGGEIDRESRGHYDL